jgi:hypothetical protein
MWNDPLLFMRSIGKEIVVRGEKANPTRQQEFKNDFAGNMYSTF